MKIQNYLSLQTRGIVASVIVCGVIVGLGTDGKSDPGKGDLMVAPDKDIYFADSREVGLGRDAPISFDLVPDFGSTLEFSSDWVRDLDFQKAVLQDKDFEGWKPRRFLLQNGWGEMHFSRMKSFLNVPCGSYQLTAYLENHQKPLMTSSLRVSAGRSAMVVTIPQYYSILIHPVGFKDIMQGVPQPKAPTFMCEFLRADGQPNGDQVWGGGYSWKDPKIYVHVTLPARFRLWMGVERFMDGGKEVIRGVAWPPVKYAAPDIKVLAQDVYIPSPGSFKVSNFPPTTER